LQFANLQLRAESQPDKKSSKKSKKKKKRGQSAPVLQEVPSAIPLEAQAGPSEPEQQNGKGDLVETIDHVVQTRQDPPAALLGRNFSEETSSLAKLQKVGAGTNELTSAYVMGLLFAQPPKRVAEWCELAPSDVLAYLAEHGEEGTWWLFTLDLLRWPQPRFSAMSELLLRPENHGFAAVIESMALAAMIIRADEYGKQRAIAQEGYFARRKPQELRTFNKAMAAMKKLVGPETRRLSMIELWMRVTAAEAWTRLTLLEARISKAIPQTAASSFGLLATIYSPLSNEIMQGAAPGSSEELVLAAVLKDGQRTMKEGEDLLAKEGTLRKSRGAELDLVREEKEQLAAVLLELKFGLSQWNVGPEKGYEPASLQSGFATWVLVRLWWSSLH
jgi:hypothetical protein